MSAERWRHQGTSLLGSVPKEELLRPPVGVLGVLEVHLLDELNPAEQDLGADKVFDVEAVVARRRVQGLAAG